MASVFGSQMGNITKSESMRYKILTGGPEGKQFLFFQALNILFPSGWQYRFARLPAMAVTLLPRGQCLKLSRSHRWRWFPGAQAASRPKIVLSFSSFLNMLALLTCGSNIIPTILDIPVTMSYICVRKTFPRGA